MKIPRFMSSHGVPLNGHNNLFYAGNYLVAVPRKLIFIEPGKIRKTLNKFTISGK